MKPTQALHDLGQSLWLDNITRDMLGDGTLARYIDELSVTGLTSNPTIFDKAITGGDAYDEQITELTEQGVEPEDIFFALALQDLQGAARSVPPRPRGDATARTASCPWRSRRFSPTTLRRRSSRSKKLHEQGARDNLFIKIPGTEAGCEAIEESIYAGIADQRHAALLDRPVPRRRRGVHARHRAPDRRRPGPGRALGGVALHEPLGRRGRRRGPRRAAQPPRGRGRQARVSRLPRAARVRPLQEARGRRGIPPAPALRQHRHQGPERVGRPLRRGAGGAGHDRHDARQDARSPSRTTGRWASPIPPDGGDADEVLAQFQAAGIDTDELAARLQREGKESFNKSWNDLLESIESESRRLAATG